MDEQYIQTQLERFNITNAALFELQKNYGWLAITDVNDKEGYKAVREARILVKNLRIDIEKKRKELLEDSLQYTRAVNAEAKRITSFMEPIEEALAQKEKAHLAEIEAIKKAEEEAQAKRLEARIDRLKFIGFKWDGIVYSSDFLNADNRPFNLNKEGIEKLSDDGFDRMMSDIRDGREKHFHAIRIEEQRKAHEALTLNSERERLAQERAELEAAKKELTDKLAAQGATELKEVLDEFPENTDLPVLKSSSETNGSGTMPYDQIINIVDVGNKQDQAQYSPSPIYNTLTHIQDSLTPAQKDFICYTIGDWYLKWKECLIDYDSRTHRLGRAKEELKIMICGETL